MAEQLRGKMALVTGASMRIGRAICLRLAEEGIQIAFNYRRSASQAEETRRDLEAKGVNVLAIQADLTDLEACDRLMRESAQITGKIDILVNNASDFPKTAAAELVQDRNRFQSTFQSLANLHMQAPLYLGLKLGLEMKRNGWGRIVNITDRVVARGQAYADWILYLATKYGLYGATQALARELAPEVTVNSIAPGLVAPPESFSPEEVNQLLRKIPLRREVGVEEIAEDVLYLIRSHAKTGSVILTDGGSSLTTF